MARFDVYVNKDDTGPRLSSLTFRANFSPA